MKRNQNYILYALLLIVVIIIVTSIITAYRGRYLGEENGPRGEYTLRYYSSFNPLKVQWSMPGGSSCKPRWIRLYDRDGSKINELYTTDCSLEMESQWIDRQVYLPDGVTVWELP